MEDVAPVGEILAREGDFWVPNPWRYPLDRNLSAFEPNRLFLNAGGLRFVDLTWLSPAGSLSDGRGAVAADFDGDLAPDLIARNIGGGPVQLFLNRFPATGRLIVRLRGRESNRAGIGARLTAEIGERRLVRDLFVHNSFTTQQPAQVEFAFGEAERVDRLLIRWPSGTLQELRELGGNRLIRITEGEAEVETIATRAPSTTSDTPPHSQEGPR
ncbi:MAG: CRTAC1 family protein [Planctomycetes bacterium]|nr:CRTAC1 family protein [Planctomycetota bacterium]